MGNSDSHENSADSEEGSPNSLYSPTSGTNDMSSPKAVEPMAADELWEKLSNQLDLASDVVRGKRASTDPEQVQDKMQVYLLIFTSAKRDPNVPKVLYTQLEEWIDAHLKKTIRSQLDTLFASVRLRRLSRPIASSRASSKRRGDRKPKSTATDEHDDETIFDEISTIVWHEYAAFRGVANIASTLLGYVDRYYARTKGLPPVEALFHRGFCDVIFKYEKDKLRRSILSRMDKYRDGDYNNAEELRSMAALFANACTSAAKTPEERHALLQQEFTRHYLHSLEAYYQQVSHRMAKGDAISILNWVLGRYKAEHEMCLHMLVAYEEKAGKRGSKKSVKRQVDTVLDRELIQRFGQQCITDKRAGFRALVEDNREHELRRMYGLFKHSKHRVMEEEFQRLVAAQGKALLEEYSANFDEGYMAAEKPFVEKFLSLIDKFRYVAATTLEHHEGFFSAIESAAAEVCKQRVTRHDPHQPPRETSVSEILAQYMDAALRGELKDIVDPFLELERLDKLVALFTYLPDKDVFQEYYRAKLAKRLLQVSATDHQELERHVINGLQRKMGKSYTLKMVGMLNDLDRQKALEEDFLQSRDAKGLECDFQCTVLTAGHWPAYRTEVLQLPFVLERCIDSFTAYYAKHNEMRRLNWIHALGQAQLVIRFPRGTKDATMSIHQAAIVVLLDRVGVLSVEDITGFLQQDMKKGALPQLASLYFSKQYQLIELCDCEGNPAEKKRSMNKQDCFMLNPSFKSRKRRFRVHHASAHTTFGEPGEKDLDAHRKAQIDAVVVRLMKSRRTLQYKELVRLAAEHMSHLFRPKASQIKKRLEDLVNRGYIERDSKNLNQFNYLA